MNEGKLLLEKEMQTVVTKPRKTQLIQSKKIAKKVNEEPYLCGGNYGDWAGIAEEAQRILKEEKELNSE